MLGVVEQQQHPPTGDPISENLEYRSTLLLHDSQRLGNRGQQRRGFANRGQGRPRHAVRICVRDFRGGLQRQPRLSGSSRPGQRHQPRVRSLEQGDQLAQLAPPTQEGRRGDRQVRPRQAAKRGKLSGTELEQPLRRRQIFQAMLAQIADDIRELRLVHQRPCPGRKHHLTAVCRRGDARRAMHVETHVAVLGQQRRAGVHPNPRTH